MIGDGYNTVERCEYVEDNEDVDSAAPDEGPFYCEFKDEEPLDK